MVFACNHYIEALTAIYKFLVCWTSSGEILSIVLLQRFSRLAAFALASALAEKDDRIDLLDEVEAKTHPGHRFQNIQDEDVGVQQQGGRQDDPRANPGGQYSARRSWRESSSWAHKNCATKYSWNVRCANVQEVLARLATRPCWVSIDFKGSNGVFRQLDRVIEAEGGEELLDDLRDGSWCGDDDFILDEGRGSRSGQPFFRRLGVRERYRLSRWMLRVASSV